MKRLFFNLLLVKVLNQKKIVLIFIFFIFFILLWSFQTEIILYFYPDLVLIELNNLINTEVHVVTDNLLSSNKGYIFFNPDYVFKTLSLSMSMNLYKYKRFIKYIVLRQVDDSSDILLKKKRYYIKPLYYKYIATVLNRDLYAKHLLLKYLLDHSTFFQRLKLNYLEYYESFLLRKRKTHRRFSILMDIMHSFPGIDVYANVQAFWNFEVRHDDELKEPELLDQFRYYNSVNKFTYFNIYKKFSYYIFKNFFINRVEPYKFYSSLYKKKRDWPVIFSDELYVAQPINEWYLRPSHPYIFFQFHRPTKWYEDYGFFDINPWYEANQLIEPFSLRNPRQSDHWGTPWRIEEIDIRDYFGDSPFESQLCDPRSFIADRIPYDRNLGENRGKIDYSNNRIYMGFAGAKSHFRNPNKRRVRKFRFSSFYNEKNLFIETPYINPLRFVVQRVWWMSMFDNFSNWNQKGLWGFKKAWDSKNRASYWMNVFSRYGYRFKDYFFYKSDDLMTFKKYNISYQDEWFFFPFFYRCINFISRFFFYFYKLLNFFASADNEINVKRDIVFIKDNINVFNFNSFFFKYGLIFMFIYLFFFFFKSIFLISFFLLGKFFNLVKIVLSFFFFIFYKIVNFSLYYILGSILFLLDKLFNIKAKINFIIYWLIFKYRSFRNSYVNFMIIFKKLEYARRNKKQEKIYRRARRLYERFLMIFRPYYKYRNKFFKKFDYYKFKEFLFKFDNNFFTYFLYDLSKQITFFKFFGISSFMIRVFFVKFVVFSLLIYLYAILLSRIWRSYEADDDIYNWEFFLILFISFYVWYLLALNLPLLLPFIVI